MKKEFITGLVVGLCIAFTFGFTSSGIQKIKVHFIPVKFMADGVEVSIQNKLFTYNDSIYVPLKAVGQILDKPITWEGAKKTVWVGKQPYNTFIYLKDLKVLRTQGDAWEVSDRWNKKEGGDALQIAGKKYVNGWYQRFWETNSKSREKEFLLNDNFNYIEGLVGIDDYTINTINEATCKIYVDDEEKFSVDVKGGEEAIPFKIDLNGKKRLKLYVQTHGSSKDPVSVDFAEVKLYYNNIDR